MGELESIASIPEEHMIHAGGADSDSDMSIEDFAAREELPFDIPRD